MFNKKCVFQKQVTKNVRLEYLLYLPESYGKDEQKRWPLILFLHGKGGIGNNLEKIRNIGLAKVMEETKDSPFIVVAPQCPQGTMWLFQDDALIAMLDDIILNYKVDEDRVCLTGQSMGGYGTWYLAAKYSDRFAAIAPICGGGIKGSTRLLRDVPAWVFHGAKDQIVPLEESEKMVEAMKSFGGNVKLTVYPEAGHNCWVETYANPELFEWLLQQKRKR